MAEDDYYQQENLKRFGKKNQDDKRDASKIQRSSPSPTPSITPEGKKGSFGVNLQDAIDRKIEKRKAEIE